MLNQGLVYAFINFEQAARFGHIGWGFRLEDQNSFIFGSTDHLYHHDVWDLPAWIRYMAVPPGDDIDWWCETGTELDMLSTMRTGVHASSGRHIRYHAYKAVPVAGANPLRARECAQAQRTGGWSVLENNCVHHAYQIFSEYGAAPVVPNPCAGQTLRIPKTWFASLQGSEILL